MLLFSLLNSWLNCDKTRAGNVSFKTSMSNCDKAVFRAKNVTREVSSPTCDKAVFIAEYVARVKKFHRQLVTRLFYF
jgi:hypothetical protein